jgi:hypothetical protein
MQINQSNTYLAFEKAAAAVSNRIVGAFLHHLIRKHEIQMLSLEEVPIEVRYSL